MDPSSLSKEELLILLEAQKKLTEEERVFREAESQRADEERKRREQAEELTSPTSFEGFLLACHLYITVPLTVQQDKSLTTKGGVTAPIGRYCPTFLEKWDFRRAQQPFFDQVYEYFHPPNAPERRVFSPRQILEHQGQTACRRPLGSEGDLERHQFHEIEIPIYDIFQALAAIPAAKARFALADGIIFENHLNSLTEAPANVETPITTRTARPDQNCIFHQENGERNLIYVTEYKAAHKLTDDIIRKGLREMNMYEEVVQRAIIPDKDDPDGIEEYNAENLTCAALTQTYDYMITQGLEYSCLTNGGVKVMLRVPVDSPETLQYDIIQPKRDARPMDELNGFRFPFTSVACHLGLTLLALRSPRRDQAWRNSAQSTLNRWEVNFEAILQNIPVTERKIRRCPAYSAPAYPINPRSPYLLRNRKARPTFDADTHNIVRKGPGPPPSDDEADEDVRDLPSSPLQSRERRKRQRNTTNAQPSSSGQQSGSQRLPYCTQRCLGGLVHRLPLDPNCPNLELHKHNSKGNLHSLSLPKVLALMECQINDDPDSCHYLNKGGIHGSIFALTLKGYGYTCIGKGTNYKSKHEAHIYNLLAPLQGITVPVFLGDVHFTKSKYFLLDRTIIQLSLMAWGGKPLSEGWPPIENKDLGGRIQQAQRDLLSCKIVHLDLEERNILWNEEIQGVMVIDFGRVKVMETPKRKTNAVLGATSTNPKRAQVPV